MSTRMLKNDVNMLTLIIRDAVTFERNRPGEPRTIKGEDFDRWLAEIKDEQYRAGRTDGALFGELKN